MNGRNGFRGKTLFGVIKKPLLCLLLAGLGVAFLRSAAWMMPLNEKRLDLSNRLGAVENKEPVNADESDRLRFAVASMVSAEATFSTYKRLVQRICRDVGLKEAFILQPSYTDVRRGLEEGNIDVAFVCTGTYVYAQAEKKVKLLVQPEFSNGLHYQCIFIVPANSPFKSVEDLRGGIMALTDPESNTGCLVPSVMLSDSGYDVKTFFKKIIFTGSHDRSILAVARGVVDMAAVDSLVWESNIRQKPSLKNQVRIIWRSEPFGPPPVVVPKELPKDLEDSLREAFLRLNKHDEGQEILSEIGIKRFVPSQPERYQTAIELHQRLELQGGFQWP